MGSSFSQEERKKYMFKKHIKNHLFEYILDFLGPIILTIILLNICKAEEKWIGIILACAYSVIRIAYSIIHYKKEFIDIDIK